MWFIPIGHEFVAEVTGIDLRAPLDAGATAAIHAAMDRYAVLLFHDQPLSDDEQIAFTKALGKIELNTANNVTRLDQRRLGIEMSDISNLDQQGNLLARDDRRRAFNLGNRLWHSDSSFKAVSAKYSLLSARIVPSAGGNTEFADMRAAYDTLDPETKAAIGDLITVRPLAGPMVNSAKPIMAFPPAWPLMGFACAQPILRTERGRYEISPPSFSAACRHRCRRIGSAVARTGARLSDSAGALGGRIPARRPAGHRRAAAGSIPVRAIRPAIHHREPIGRRRQYWRRGCNQWGARRLHDVAGRFAQCHQRDAL